MHYYIYHGYVHSIPKEKSSSRQQKLTPKNILPQEESSLKLALTSFSLPGLEMQTKNKDIKTEIELFLAKLKSVYQKKLFHIYSVYTVFKREYEGEEIQRFFEILLDEGLIYQPQPDLYKIL